MATRNSLQSTRMSNEKITSSESEPEVLVWALAHLFEGRFFPKAFQLGLLFAEGPRFSLHVDGRGHAKVSEFCDQAGAFIGTNVETLRALMLGEAIFGRTDRPFFCSGDKQTLKLVQGALDHRNSVDVRCS